MAHLTQAQKDEYWRHNVRLGTVLFLIWFVVTFVISSVTADWLNRFRVLGSPLRYDMAAQGSLVIFVVETATYAFLMNRKDEEYGVREDG